MRVGRTGRPADGRDARCLLPVVSTVDPARRGYGGGAEAVGSRQVASPWRELSDVSLSAWQLLTFQIFLLTGSDYIRVPTINGIVENDHLGCIARNLASSPAAHWDPWGGTLSAHLCEKYKIFE